MAVAVPAATAAGLENLRMQRAPHIFKSRRIPEPTEWETVSSIENTNHHWIEKSSS